MKHETTKYDAIIHLSKSAKLMHEIGLPDKEEQLLKMISGLLFMSGKSMISHADKISFTQPKENDYLFSAQLLDLINKEKQRQESNAGKIKSEVKTFVQNLKTSINKKKEVIANEGRNNA